MAKNVPKFPIIGGPLDGKHANQKDFWPEYVDNYSRKINEQGGRRKVMDRPEGQFYEHRREYHAYNNADGTRHPDRSSMVWLHHSLLSPSIRAPQ